MVTNDGVKADVPAIGRKYGLRRKQKTLKININQPVIIYREVVAICHLSF
jgi:hypothetical protein